MPVTENDRKRAMLLIGAGIHEPIGGMIDRIAEALEGEREAVIDRVLACLREYSEGDVDMRGLVAELRRAGEF